MYSIAIDGPAGAGKSTLARGVAQELGFIYVDTGALYRAIALHALRSRANLDDAASLRTMLQALQIQLRHIDGEQHVFLNGEDVSAQIRTPEVSMMASRVSALPLVRAHLLTLQRELAEKNSVIMDGRDIGTVVLPNADVKLFVTAKPECRAERRYKELLAAGKPADFYQVLEEIQQRDFNDSHRAIAPLRPAEDAELFDSTGKKLEESVAEVTALIRKKLSL